MTKDEQTSVEAQMQERIAHAAMLMDRCAQLAAQLGLALARIKELEAPADAQPLKAVE